MGERVFQTEKRAILGLHLAAVERICRRANSFDEITTLSASRFFGAVDIALEFLASPARADQEASRKRISSLTPEQLRRSVEEDMAAITQILWRYSRHEPETVLFALGPRALKAYGPLLIYFFDRLMKAQTNSRPMLIVIGEDAAQYSTGIHPSVVLAAETPADAAAALAHLRTKEGVERVQYLSTTREYRDMLQVLQSPDSPHVEQMPLGTFPLFLQRILYALAGVNLFLGQTITDPFSGINLRELAENLKALAALGA